MTDSEKLHRPLMTVLDLQADEDVTTVAYGATETWDSVAHMQLILALEDAFGITTEPDDVVAMSSYAAAARILRDHHGLDFDGR